MIYCDMMSPLGHTTLNNFYLSHLWKTGDRLIIGICNGFQTMTKMGILPGLDNDYRTQLTTVTYNDSGRFEDRWVYLTVLDSACVFTRGIEKLYLPVRHGEGKEGIVIEELQKGYKLHDRVIRPAMVVVGNGENEEKKEEE